MKYLNVQVLRVVLFLCIFLFHCGLPFASMGWFGVESFLVITSFLLADKYLHRASDKPAYKLVYDRMKRLAPPYYVLLAFSLALYVLFHHKFNGEVFWFVTYMQNYYWMHTNYQTGLAYLGHTWYLSLDITLFAIYIYIYVVARKVRQNADMHVYCADCGELCVSTDIDFAKFAAVHNGTVAANLS